MMPFQVYSLSPVEPVEPHRGLTSAVRCRLTSTTAVQSRLTRTAAFASRLTRTMAVESGLSSLDGPHLHSRTLTVTPVGAVAKSTTGPTSTLSPVTPASAHHDDTRTTGLVPLQLASPTRLPRPRLGPPHQ